MSTFKEGLDEDYNFGVMQRAASQFMRQPNPRDVGLPLVILVLHQAIKTQRNRENKKELIEILEMLSKMEA